jgi:hypothetical protein
MALKSGFRIGGLACLVVIAGCTGLRFQKIPDVPPVKLGQAKVVVYNGGPSDAEIDLRHETDGRFATKCGVLPQQPLVLDVPPGKYSASERYTAPNGVPKARRGVVTVEEGNSYAWLVGEDAKKK